MSRARLIEVPEDDDGQRLDRWLRKNAEGVPYVLIQKLIRKGQVRIDGKRASGESRLRAGQSVRIPPIAQAPAEKPGGPDRLESDRDFLRALIIYEDKHVFALNKPSGLAVQGGSGTRRHIDGMLDGLAGKGGVRPRLVHRLDKDTSGVLLLARSAQAARALGKMFEGRGIRKTYWAVIAGVPDMPRGTIRAALIKGEKRDKDKMVPDEENGKKSITEYAVLESIEGKAAFAAFWPRTGRTHQIRAHAALIGCPILGDVKYGGEAAEIEGLGHASRLHLHARRLTLPHPSGKGVLDVEAPLPFDLAKSWRAMGFDPAWDLDPFESLK